jgi:hypothetical protein
VTFWALGEMVKAQAGILETDPAATALGKLDRCVNDLMPSDQSKHWLEGFVWEPKSALEPAQR